MVASDRTRDVFHRVDTAVEGELVLLGKEPAPDETGRIRYGGEKPGWIGNECRAASTTASARSSGSDPEAAKAPRTADGLASLSSMRRSAWPAFDTTTAIRMTPRLPVPATLQAASSTCHWAALRGARVPRAARNCRRALPTCDRRSGEIDVAVAAG